MPSRPWHAQKKILKAQKFDSIPRGWPVEIFENPAKSGVRKRAHCARLGGARIDIRYRYEPQSPEDSESVKLSRPRPFLGGQFWTRSWEIVLATFLENEIERTKTDFQSRLDCGQTGAARALKLSGSNPSDQGRAPTPLAAPYKNFYFGQNLADSEGSSPLIFRKSGEKSGSETRPPRPSGRG